MAESKEERSAAAPGKNVNTGHRSAADRPLHFLCDRFWPLRHGGVEQRMWQVTRAMAGAGCDVGVITENRANAQAKESIEPGVHINRLDVMETGRLWRLRSFLRVQWWKKHLTHASAGGTLWATAPPQAVAAIRAGRASDLVYNPACCTAAMIDLGKRHPHLKTMQLSKPIMRQDRFAYRKAGKVVVGSHNLREQLEKHFGSRPNVHVIPHGTETPTHRVSRRSACERLGLNHDDFIIGFVGRLDPCKGLDHLFHAVQMLDPRYRGRVLIVGDGPDRARLEYLATSLGINHLIRWLGVTDDPAVAYAAMNVFVLPSVYEAFGNVLLEAMAMGVPVMGRRRDGMDVLTANEEIITHGKTGVLVDSHDAEDLAANLAALASDLWWCSSLGEAARMQTAGRTWHEVAMDYLAMLGQTPKAARQDQQLQAAA